jgi:DnaJ-class molecular chaperone
MMNNYFLNCHTEESVKIRYRKLSKELHPDKNKENPDATKKFQQMTDQRDAALRVIYRKAGLSDNDIEMKLRDFLSEFINGNTANLNSIADEMAQRFKDDNPDKEMNTKNVFAYVFKTMLGSLSAKNVSGTQPRNQLDRDPN